MTRSSSLKNVANNQEFFVNSRLAKRRPLHTFAEVADELGVPSAQLRAVFGHDPMCPQPVFKTSGRSAPRRTYYDMAEVKKWWEKRHPVQEAPKQ